MEDPFVADGPRRAREAAKEAAKSQEVPADVRPQGLLAQMQGLLAQIWPAFFIQTAEELRKLWLARRSP